MIDHILPSVKNGKSEKAVKKVEKQKKKKTSSYFMFLLVDVSSHFGSNTSRSVLPEDLSLFRMLGKLKDKPKLIVTLQFWEF